MKGALFATIPGSASTPPEYLEFQMCKAFGCLPHHFDELDEDTFVLFAEMLGVEAEAARLRAIPRSDA